MFISALFPTLLFSVIQQNKTHACVGHHKLRQKTFEMIFVNKRRKRERAFSLFLKHYAVTQETAGEIKSNLFSTCINF